MDLTDRGGEAVMWRHNRFQRRGVSNKAMNEGEVLGYVNNLSAQDGCLFVLSCRVVWKKFTEASKVPAASIIRAMPETSVNFY
jgi:hypothetical protein